MALKLKKIETRGWSTDYRGPLLIHAAKRKPRKDEMNYILHHLKATSRVDPYSIFYTMPFGAIVCEVYLYDCVKLDSENKPSLDTFERWAGNYENGRYMWLTQFVRRFDPPIPFRGQQGFFGINERLIPGINIDHVKM